MFRDYDGNLDWGSIGFTCFIALVAVGFVTVFVLAIKSTKEIEQKQKAFKAACIDAGGYPTTPFDYVKGHGEGYLCINPSAIIRLEEVK